MTPDELRNVIRTTIRNYNTILNSELAWRDSIIHRAVASKWSRRWIADEMWTANRRINDTKRMIAMQYELMRKCA